MYNIVFYANKRGEQPVKEYIDSLKVKAETSKDSRIKITKIVAYLDILAKNGTRAGENFIKHLEDGIWELRPINDRILFFYWNQGTFVLLHHFKRRLRKHQGVKLNKQREAKKIFLKGVIMTEKRSPIGESWNEYRETLLTPEERHEIDIKVEIITAILNARNKAGYSQKQLERLTGVKQPVISRMEKGETDPRLSTIMKILEPLGKTLVVVDKL